MTYFLCVKTQNGNLKSLTIITTWSKCYCFIDLDFIHYETGIFMFGEKFCVSLLALVDFVAPAIFSIGTNLSESKHHFSFNQFIKAIDSASPIPIH